MKNRFVISEDEKQRILGLHETAKNQHGTVLSEQYMGVAFGNEQNGLKIKKGETTEQAAPQPKTQGNVAKPQGDIKYVEIAGSTDPKPINSAGALTKYGLPATNKDFRDFFYTDRNGIYTAAKDKNLSSFSMKMPNKSDNKDIVSAQYNDGRVINLLGNGTQVFPMNGLKFLGGAGNGLLALQRAFFLGPGERPSQITITLGGGRSGSSYNYNSAQVNETEAAFDTLLAQFVRPLVDSSKMVPNYPFKNVILGQPQPHETISGILNGLLGKFVPSPFRENVTKLGLNMNVPEFEKIFNEGVELSEANDKWGKVQEKIIAKYKENLEKFLSENLPNKKEEFMKLFNPKRAHGVPTQEIKLIYGGKFGPGVAVPQAYTGERRKSQQFKVGQGS